jgi:hypothetical protein
LIDSRLADDFTMLNGSESDHGRRHAANEQSIIVLSRDETIEQTVEVNLRVLYEIQCRLGNE